MEFVQPIIQAIYEAPFSTAIRESEWTFPIIQTFHILGILLFYGPIVLVDFRIIGLGFRQRPVAEVMQALLPLAWLGFAVLAVSGGILFAAQAAKIYTNAFLLTKFALIGLAGVNLLVFHVLLGKAVAAQGVETPPVQAAPAMRASAALSLALWTGVVVAGRFIAYF